jgi:hypothetical protein
MIVISMVSGIHSAPLYPVKGFYSVRLNVTHNIELGSKQQHNHLSNGTK